MTVKHQDWLADGLIGFALLGLWLTLLTFSSARLP
jgi:hypothetical protein